MARDFQHTLAARLDAAGDVDAWAPFRVEHARERLALLRQLRDGGVPLIVTAPGGASLAATLWSLDAAQQRLGFSVDADSPQLASIVEADEAVAVAYLDSVKLQFDLLGLVLVHGARNTLTLQAQLPAELYRFQRRNAYRVRPPARPDPVAQLRHPSLPDMQLALRVLDVSIGGCALWLPADVPPLQAGTRIGELTVVLDAVTRFSSAAVLQHVSALGAGDRGVRLGCEWQPLPGAAERTLQRWIDQAQKRRRLLGRGE